MTTNERVKLLITKTNLSQKKFAQSLRISPSRLHNYLSGIRDIPQDILVKIVKLTGCEYKWLLTGEGSMFQKTELVELKDTDFIRLPVIANIAAGSPLEVYEDYEPLEYIDVPVSMLTLPPPYFVFQVEGDSMSPEIQPGDYVILSQDWRGIKLDGRICGFRTPDGITLKKVKYQPQGQITWLIPLNHLKYDPVPYTSDTDDLVLFGVMITLIRKF